MYWSTLGNVYFVEGNPEGFQPIQEINTELNEFFSQNHLRNLSDVKARMADEVARLHGNAVCNFKYGQRSSFWKSIGGMDNVLWYATGVVGTLGENAVAALRSQK